MGTDFLIEPKAMEQGVMVSIERAFRLAVRNISTMTEMEHRTQKQAAQSGDRHPSTGTIQGQVGRGSEQPGLFEAIPAHCRGMD